MTSILKIHRITDPRGNLAVIGRPEGLPFEPKRCYWLNDVPCGEMREGHAYRSSTEFIVALAGSFRVTVNHAGTCREFTLSRPDEGLLVPPMTWRQFHDFTTNTVALVIASTPYDAADYIRLREEFESLTGQLISTDEA